MAIIRVSGHLGAGKTTVCEKLATAIGYANHYTGDVFRQLAEEQDPPMSIEEFYSKMASNPDLEREIDNRQEQLMLTENNLIVQGRIAPFLRWNTNYDKINLFFRVSDEEGARRQLKRKENQGKTFKEMLRISQERTREEYKRYGILYPHITDYLDESLFDIVIDTTSLNEEDVFIETLNKIKPFI